MFCRFRPFNEKELVANASKLHSVKDGTSLSLKEHVFMFDKIFDMDSTQDQVFERVGQPVLNNILDGFHGTIMAYGQTSSGKTHTMQGYDLSEK